MGIPKKPTMTDVAKLAGVSQSTVSFVLNNEKQSISEEVRKKIYSAIDQLAFVPRAKVQNYTKPKDLIIAVFVPNVSNLFYPQFIKSIDTYATQKGYRIIIINTNREIANEQYYFKLLINMKIAGIIFGFTPTFSDISKVKVLNIPIVVIGETFEDLGVDIVNFNSVKAGEIVANHLLELGHKEIAFITSPIESISLSRKRRLEGLSRTLRGNANLTVLTDENEFELQNTNYEFEIGFKLSDKLMKYSEKKPTAIVGANDMIAFGIINKLTELKINIPKDVSICAFDNIFFSNIISPPLTTVDHCTDQRCRLAIDLLYDKISKRSTLPMTVNYEPFLIVRESTGKITKSTASSNAN
jgi:LacI family transcriptional regulator